MAQKHWWDGYPWRMVQTNLREIDMENIDAASYAQELADFGATVVTLNSAGIIASYDTKHPYQAKSEYLHGDSLGMLIDACHEQGIRVIARTDFSKVHFDIYEKHPDWAYRTADGEIMNYNGDVQMCPNGEYQQKVMFEILEELLTTFPFDGVFCNMSGFLVTDYSGKYYGPCHCENCVRKFKEESGLDVPVKDDFTDPTYLKYMAFKSKVTAEHKARLKALVKGISPEIAMNNVDYIRSESNTEIGRAQWPYSASSNSRLAAGRYHNRPSDNAAVDFLGFRYRDTSVSPAQMALRQWQNLVGSGCVSLYVMGTLGEHKDKTCFEPTKKVFKFHREHEKLFADLQSAADVLLLRKGMWQRTDPGVAGWIRCLTESHVPFDEMNVDELADANVLQEYKTIILGDLKGLKPNQSQFLNDFVKNGGTIIATGETKLECLGVDSIIEHRRKSQSEVFEIAEAEEDIFALSSLEHFIAPGEDIMLVEARAGAKTYLHLIDEHPYGPPERCYYTDKDVTTYPGVIINTYGEGKSIYIPFKIAGFYMNEGYANSVSFMRDVLYHLADVKSLAQDESPMFEITKCKRKSDGAVVLQLINTTGVWGNSFFEPVPLQNIKINPGCAIKEIETLCGGALDITGDTIILNKLNDYEAIIIREPLAEVSHAARGR